LRARGVIYHHLRETPRRRILSTLIQIEINICNQVKPHRSQRAELAVFLSRVQECAPIAFEFHKGVREVMPVSSSAEGVGVGERKWELASLTRSF
jgi:hypothetical protein